MLQILRVWDIRSRPVLDDCWDSFWSEHGKPVRCVSAIVEIHAVHTTEAIYSRRPQSRELSVHPRLSVCLHVCISDFPHDNSKRNEPKVFKLGTENDLGISSK